MTLQVRIICENEVSGKCLAIYQRETNPEGGNKKQRLITKLSQKDQAHVGYVHDKADLVIQEENL